MRKLFRSWFPKLKSRHEERKTVEQQRPRIKELVVEASRVIDDFDFGYQLLEADQLGKLLGPERSRKAVISAMDAGRRVASNVEKEYGTSAPSMIAEKVGVQVVYKKVEEGPAMGHFVKCSEYDPGLLRSPKITIYEGPITALRSVIREQGLQDILQIGDISQVYLAHELYHFLESGIAGQFEEYRVRNLEIGPIKVRQDTRILSEVASHTFVKNLLDLTFHPKLLDYLVIYSVNPIHSHDLLRELVKSHRGSGDSTLPKS
jgi:hypothetical protein